MKNYEFEAMVKMYAEHSLTDHTNFHRLYDTLKPIKIWQNNTFPHSVDNPGPPLAHLYRELEELKNTKYESLEEWADVVMLVFGMVFRSKFDLVTVMDAVMVKYYINRVRKWGEPDIAGVSQHIEEA